MHSDLCQQIYPILYFWKGTKADAYSNHFFFRNILYMPFLSFSILAFCIFHDDFRIELFLEDANGCACFCGRDEECIAKARLFVCTWLNSSKSFTYAFLIDMKPTQWKGRWDIDHCVKEAPFYKSVYIWVWKNKSRWIALLCTTLRIKSTYSGTLAHYSCARK